MSLCEVFLLNQGEFVLHEADQESALAGGDEGNGNRHVIAVWLRGDDRTPTEAVMLDLGAGLVDGGEPPGAFAGLASAWAVAMAAISRSRQASAYCATSSDRRTCMRTRSSVWRAWARLGIKRPLSTLRLSLCATTREAVARARLNSLKTTRVSSAARSTLIRRTPCWRHSSSRNSSRCTSSSSS